ncbi:uncharacterized protein LOC143350246 [Colletes latitarsis]|uniref:uncharacterized protein LOC143350246 n=1 Tax=Colletes latitarsis TaxID=2605962 RepID=UPI004036D9C9
MTVAVKQNRMAMTKETFAQCQDLDAKISAVADHKIKATYTYFAEDLLATCEQKYQEALDFMAEVLMGVSPPPDPAAANGQNLNVAPQHPTAHLPRINLPTFEGTFEHWESFRDRFTSMVIDNQSLSNVERLHFLHASLKGEASLAVSHLPVTDHNFEVAWKIITPPYENKHRLISTHLNVLFTLPTVVSETQFELRALRDKLNMSIEMLQNLDRPVAHWSDIFVFLGAQKLDRTTRKAWEFNLGDTTVFCTYREFDAFLEKRIRSLEAMPVTKRDKPSEPEKPKSILPKTFHAHSTATSKISCALCKQNHLIYQCSEFLGKSPSKRYQLIKQQNRCVNCFFVGHSTALCKNPHCCKEYHQRHHTLLHFPVNKNSSVTASRAGSSISNDQIEISSNLSTNSLLKITVLLSTERVQVHSPQGRCVTARALLDQGSAATLITENLAQLLRLKRTSQYTRISGIGEKHSFTHQVASISIKPADQNEPAYSTTAIIMQTLTRYVPSRQKQNVTWPYLAELNLADMDPMSSNPIDIIIGADLYGQLLLQGVIRGSGCVPTAQSTALGWILSGPIQIPGPDDVHIHLSVLEYLDHNLRRFWEVEELPTPAVLTPDEQNCERHFAEIHSRTSEGPYIVRLPFRDDRPIHLGDSRSRALSSLRSQENRLKRDPNSKREYQEFLSEYQFLGHMRKVDPPSPIAPPNAYYIPHHPVIRQTSQTTRLRVVFNASSQHFKWQIP